MSPHDSFRVPPPRLGRDRGHQPSFSAALLDAIYHSLEADADAGARTPTGPRRAPASPAQRTPVSSRRRPTTPALSRSGSLVRSPRLQMPPRPCRVRPDPQPNSLLQPPPPPPYEATVDRAGKKRVRKKKKKKTTARTRAAPFACLLNALLCNRRSAKPVDHTPRATAAAPEPASARSILSSRASRRGSAATGAVMTPARRAVRFSPVAVVVDDEHGRGVGTATRLRDAEMEAMSAKESPAQAERRVEELLRALRVAEEKERAKESSESSSDLFELESLPPAFEDTELPRSRVAAGVGLARPRPHVL
ncbi:hypothetical protein ACP70R_026103 [Stipagrostis hirtigluma subsp. patula]